MNNLDYLLGLVCALLGLESTKLITTCTYTLCALIMCVCMYSDDRRSAVLIEEERRQNQLKIETLREAVSKSQADSREKDRTIQRQRDTMERLEHRVAAEDESLKYKNNMITIKDNLLRIKDSMVQKLDGSLTESNAQIENLQRTLDSSKAQVEEKTQLLYNAVDRENNADQHTAHQQSTHDATTKKLKSTINTLNNAIDFLEEKYQKTIADFEAKLKASDERTRREAQDARKYRSRIANEMPDLIANLESRTTALRENKDLLKSSEIERQILLDEKANCHTQRLLEQAKKEIAARDTEIANCKMTWSTHSETTGTDHEVLGSDLTNVRDDLNIATHALDKRNAAFDRLNTKYESDMKAAASEREDLQAQIVTLKNDLWECKGRLITVNTSIIDHKTQLSRSLGAQENLVNKLMATTHLAEETASRLCFAQHAQKNALNQITSLTAEKDLYKAAKQQCVDKTATIIALETSLAEAQYALRDQKGKTSLNANRYAQSHHLHKKAKLEIADLQTKAAESTAETADLKQTIVGLANGKAHYRYQYKRARTSIAALQEVLHTSTQILAASEKARFDLADKSTKLTADLTTAQFAALAMLQDRQNQMQRQEEAAQAGAEEAKTAATADQKDLALAQSKVEDLTYRLEQSDKRFDAALQRVRFANEDRAAAVFKLQKAAPVVVDLRRRVVRLGEELGRERLARTLVEEKMGEIERVRGEEEEEEEEARVMVGEAFVEVEKGEAEEAGVGVEEGEGMGEDEDEDEEEFETLKVLEGREPVEVGEGFEFVVVK